MADDKGAAFTAPDAVSRPSNLKDDAETSSSDAGGQRLWFHVELKPGDTTIVSWKRLLKQSGGESGSPPRPVVDAAAVNPDGAAGVGTNRVLAEAEANEVVPPPPPSRFSAVIEKIERLYMGLQSSDEEELDDVPDDDQYDTEDSFIDDAELDEYFQVDKLKTKHNGYFVNKGELEQIGNEPSSSVRETPKKRRRKDTMKHQGDDCEPGLAGIANMGNMQMKGAALSSPLVGKQSSSCPQIPTLQCELLDNGSKGSVVKLDNTIGIVTGEFPDLSNKVQQIATEVLSLPLEHMYSDNHKAGSSASKDDFEKSKGANTSSELVYHASCSNGYLELQSQWFMNVEHDEITAKVRQKKRYKTGDLSGWNSFGSACPMNAGQFPKKMKEGSSVRHKRTTLDRAIHDLEKIVAEYKPPSFHIQHSDSVMQGVKRRLPQEVKQKLAKVARLSGSQGKISQELIDRLMGILGHLVQRRTLKRNMKEMIALGLSVKQQKADRLQHIKGEVYEMIKAQVSVLKSKVNEQQDASADYFQEVMTSDGKKVLQGKYSMDVALEDKICDLYDLHVEGMDEAKGPESRKLYVELADLWPTGYMDNIGIKDAIYRSKERKRMLYGSSKQHKGKRLSSSLRVEVQGLHERLFLDNSVQCEGNLSEFPDDTNKSVFDAKRKKKLHFDSWETHAYPMKIASQNMPEPQILLKQAFVEQPQLTLGLLNVTDSDQLN